METPQPILALCRLRLHADLLCGCMGPQYEVIDHELLGYAVRKKARKVPFVIESDADDLFAHGECREDRRGYR